MVDNDWVLLHSHVELRKSDSNDHQSGPSRKYFLHSPYLEPLEVFIETTRFSKISDAHIAELRRGVYAILGWQLESAMPPEFADRADTEVVDEESPSSE